MNAARPEFVEQPWPATNTRVAVTVDFYDGAMSGILASVEEPGELGFRVAGFVGGPNPRGERVARAWPLALGTADRVAKVLASLPFGAARLAIAGAADAEVRAGRAAFPERSKYVVEFGPRGEAVRVWKSSRPVADAEVIESFGLSSARALWELIDAE